LRLASILLFALATRLLCAGEDSSDIRQQELALARALQAGERASLLRLTSDQFSFHLACGSPATKSFSAEWNRQDWMNDFASLRLNSYEAEISKIDLRRPSRPVAQNNASAPSMAAVAILDESCSLRSPAGDSLRRRLHSVDVWLKVQGAWKLLQRTSQSNGPECGAGPHLAFPER
jgi:hypothetical protein